MQRELAAAAVRLIGRSSYNVPHACMHRHKKKRLARAFTVITAVLLLLLFIVRDIVRENLKDLHDSLARAEMQFQNHVEQAEIFRELLQGQQEDLAKTVAVAPQANSADAKAVYDRWKTDYWLREIDLEQKGLDLAEDDFYSASDLLDALPSGTTDLRKIRGLNPGYTEGIDGYIREGETDLRTMLEKSRAELDKGEKAFSTLSAQNQLRGQAPKVGVVDGIVFEQRYRILNVGWFALDLAKHVQQTRERLIRICSWIIYVLGGLVLVLGIYATSIGLKPEGNEAT